MRAVSRVSMQMLCLEVLSSEGGGRRRLVCSLAVSGDCRLLSVSSGGEAAMWFRTLLATQYIVDRVLYFLVLREESWETP